MRTQMKKRCFTLFLVLVIAISQGCSKKVSIGTGENSYNMYFRSNTSNEWVNIAYYTNTMNFYFENSYSFGYGNRVIVPCSSC